MSEKISIIEDHPRPDFARPEWMSLDGTWELAFDRRDLGVREDWHRRAGLPYRVEAPFPVESSLSGIGLERSPRIVWYLRRFDLPESWRGRRVRLHFGAVDYHATVWVNRRRVGVHEGGYTPFSFDITDMVSERDNCIVIRVRDDRTPFQVRGKQTQRRKSWSIFYTTVTGLWQSVWLEATGRTRLAKAHIEADPKKGEFSLTYDIEGQVTGVRMNVEIQGPDGEAVPLQNGGVVSVSGEGTINWSIPDARTWSPEEPNLYVIRYRLINARGEMSDEAVGYFGFRSVETRDGRVLLNGRPFYHRFLLNQGYFPDGIYRPGDPGRYRRDVQDALDMGFNGIRMHQKVEDPRFLYWCDRLGLVVWAEMPSFHLPRKRCADTFKRQWMEVIDRDFNHPCIIAWLPFNEQWGIQNVWISRTSRELFKTVVRQTRAKDSTRLVIDNSGWEHIDSDILDIHSYAWSEKVLGRLLKLLGEAGGMRFSVRKALLLGGRSGWPVMTKPLLGPRRTYRGEPIIISEYGGFGFYPTQKGSLMDNLRAYTLAIARADHIAGFCYTQQYDVEQERNGLLTYDRKPKIDFAQLRRLNEDVMKIVEERASERRSVVTPIRLKAEDLTGC